MTPILREKHIVAEMIRLYARHHPDYDPAPLLAYALCRLDHCPEGDHKPACRRCPHHCYRPDMRAQIRLVMRYAGPRMLLRHPIMALRHLL